MKTPEYYAVNRWNKTACKVSASCWEQLQCMFRIGIQMPDGDLATGIGRCNKGEFEKRASVGGWRNLSKQRK